MTTTTPKPVTSLEVYDSLTGYDEDKITTRFGSTVEDLDGIKFLRALLFAQALHAGQKDSEAYKAAMELTQAQVKERFIPVEDDELPGSETGKDDE